MAEHNSCGCYHKQRKRRYTFDMFTGQPIGHSVDVGVCWGTKERDECSCGGDMSKCNFYKEVRQKARQRKPDLVEVVRCKDCDVPHNKWLGCPNLNGLIPPPNFYCARGERKDGAGDA